MILLKNGVELDGHEVDSVYVDQHDRYIVSFLISYGEESRVVSPLQAAAAALKMAEDPTCMVYVYDVVEQQGYVVERRAVEALMQEMR